MYSLQSCSCPGFEVILAKLMYESILGVRNIYRTVRELRIIEIVNENSS